MGISEETLSTINFTGLNVASLSKLILQMFNKFRVIYRKKRIE